MDTQRVQLSLLDSTAAGDWGEATHHSIREAGGVLPQGTFLVCSPPPGADAPQCPEKCDICAAVLARGESVKANSFAVALDGIVTGAPLPPPLVLAPEPLWPRSSTWLTSHPWSPAPSGCSVATLG